MNDRETTAVLRNKTKSHSLRLSLGLFEGVSFFLSLQSEGSSNFSILCLVVSPLLCPPACDL